MYRDAKKREALQRVQYEIDQHALKMKVVRENKKKREQLAQALVQEQENQKQVTLQVKLNESEQIE